MGNESEDGLQRTGPRKKSLLVQLVMGPAQSDCWLFWRKGEGNKDNILLKYREGTVFLKSLALFITNWKEYTLRVYFWVRLAFFTFLYLPFPVKFYSFYKW